MGKINVAVVGCGSFATHMHLPNMRKDGRYHIYAACDVVEEMARGVADEYGSEYVMTDVDRVFQDDAVDLVMITTRHNTHAELSIRAAKAGKNILCEKPMGIDDKECREVYMAVKENNVKYCIGYNRGLAPMVAGAREILADLKRPFAMYHRMQNYFAPEGHWLLDAEEGGGRLVGEGCHIFDMACALAGCEPVRVFAEGGVFTLSKTLTVPDTAAVTMAFEDGSVATTVIASVGNSGLSKEATEIYCGNVAIRIDDFKQMVLCTAGGTEETILSTVDKGHRRELALLAEVLLDGGPAPNNEENALRAALISFRANEAIRTHAVQTLSREEYML